MATFADVLRLLDGCHTAEETMAALRGAREDGERERRRLFAVFDVAPDVACPATLVYHEQSSITHAWSCPLTEEQLVDLTLNDGGERGPEEGDVALPTRLPELSTSLGAAIGGRRSGREFGVSPAALETAGELPSP